MLPLEGSRTPGGGVVGGGGEAVDGVLECVVMRMDKSLVVELMETMGH